MKFMGMNLVAISSLIVMGLGQMATADESFYNWSEEPEKFVASDLQTPNNPPTFSENRTLEAKISRSKYGIPHIEANSLEDLAFGVGMAFSQDNFCILADQILKVKSQRSLYFGPGLSGEHVASDFGHLALGVMEKAQEALPKMSENSRAMISGFTKGVNRYLEMTGKENLAPQCAGANWVKPITEEQLLAQLHLYLLSNHLYQKQHKYQKHAMPHCRSIQTSRKQNR